MYIIVSDLSKPLNLPMPIDNRSSNLCIALRSISYCIDWWNSSEGLLNVNDALVKFLGEKDVISSFNENTGILSLTPSEGKKNVTIKNQELLSMMKIELHKKGHSGKCTLNSPCKSYTAVDMMPVKSLNIHCNQINTNNNFFDGNPSNILATVPVMDNIFGNMQTYQFNNPLYKKLGNGTINLLEFSILDQNNKEITHHSEVPVNCTLEIIP